MKAFCAIENDKLGDVMGAVGQPQGYVRLHDFPASSKKWGLFVFSATPAGITTLQVQDGVETFAVVTEDEDAKWAELEDEPTSGKRTEVNAWISDERPRGFSTRFSALHFLWREIAPQSTAGQDNGVMIRGIVRHFIPSWDFGGDDVVDFA